MMSYFLALVKRLPSCAPKPWSLSTPFVQSGLKRNYGSKHEPDYLSSLGPQHPVYDLVNVQLQGYDFVVLERYQRYVHRSAERIGLTVADSWATPARTYQINTFKPQSTITDQQYKLNMYERNVQISEFPCYLAPVFFEILRNTLPEGVRLSLHPHEKDHEEIRFIPDLDLISLKSELEQLQNPDKGKKKY